LCGKQVSGTLVNTGRDLRVIVDDLSLGHSVNITGGPLSYQYRITEISLHFGSISSLGSEHTVAGVSFPAEVSVYVCVNPLECKRNDSATSDNMKLVHWPLMGGLLHLVQRRGDWAGPQPAQAPPRCTKCNSPPINGQCTNHRIAV